MEKIIPNSTQVPHLVSDLLIPRLPEAEARCILYICRRTFGFHKEEDRISFTQFINGIRGRDNKVLDYGTGLSRPSVSTALQNLNEAGVITVRKDTRGNYYSLNLEIDVDKVVKEINQLRKTTRIRKATKPKQVKLFHLQKKEKKEKQSNMQTNKSSAGDNLKTQNNGHKRFVDFFYENAQGARGVKPIITNIDGRNLKRILEDIGIEVETLEKAAFYFLYDYRFSGFSPCISTFLSAGVITGILNKMTNDPDFWKDMDNHLLKRSGSVRFTSNSDTTLAELSKLKEHLSEKMSMKKEARKVEMV